MPNADRAIAVRRRRLGARPAGTVSLRGSITPDNWTTRQSAIATAARREQSQELHHRRRGGRSRARRLSLLNSPTAAHTAMIYAFDLIERDDEDLRHLPFLDRKSALARLLTIPRLASGLTNTLPKIGLPCSPMLAGLAPRASCRRRSMAPIEPARTASGSSFAIRPASRYSGGAAPKKNRAPTHRSASKYFCAYPGSCARNLLLIPGSGRPSRGPAPRLRRPFSNRQMLHRVACFR
jgi:hypothetical protein